MPDDTPTMVVMLDNGTAWTFEGQRDDGPWLPACGRWTCAAHAAQAAMMWFNLVFEHGGVAGVRVRQIEELTAV